MNAILEIPEIVALDGPAGLIRIPQQIDVPVTPRVLRLIDTPEFQRLVRVSQLGLVSFVYPAANHNRFEHSLGVYRMSLLFLRQLAHQTRFTDAVTARDSSLLILAALLHDLGHWPFCHPIEDLNLPKVPQHEAFGSQFLHSPNVARCLHEDWGVEPAEVTELINRRATTIAGKILGSILSGPIDIDKMDYLYRDSLHAGVPYGQNFDSPRLIRSLCLNEQGDRLAISHKGKTAAELMVFARYVMFSEVYWHPAVRSATAMFQRAFYLWHQKNVSASDFSARVDRLFRLPERELIELLMTAGQDPGTIQLLQALFGSQRTLYKRIAHYNCYESEIIYRQIAQRPYHWTVACSGQLAKMLSARIGRAVEPNQVLIDAPPAGLEVQFNVDVHYEKEGRFRQLGSVSPVVQTLAHRQFDDFVKQVRIFVEPSLAAEARRLPINEMLQLAITSTD